MPMMARPRSALSKPMLLANARRTKPYISGSWNHSSERRAARAVGTSATAPRLSRGARHTMPACPALPTACRVKFSTLRVRFRPRRSAANYRSTASSTAWPGLMDHDRTLERIVAWALADDNIRVVVLTGSAAVGPELVHALSDLDVELYVTRPAALLDDDTWYAQFGEVLVVEALPNPGWHPTRLVYYVDGKIDFMLAPSSALATTRYERPFQVLLDKDGIAAHLPAASRPAGSPPTENEFLECIHWFYAAAIMCAK